MRLVQHPCGEYSSLTIAATVVAKQLGVDKKSVRRWAIQAQVDGGQRTGATPEVLAVIKVLKAKARGLEEDNAIQKSATVSSAGTADHGFIDTMRSQGHAGRVGLSGAA